MKNKHTASFAFLLASFVGYGSFGNAMMENRTTTEPSCTRTCTMLDSSPECWRESLDFYAVEAQKALRNYAAILTHVNYWIDHLPDEVKPTLEEELEAFEKTSLNRTLELFNSLRESQRAPLDEHDLRAVFEVLIKRTNDHKDEYMDDNILPVAVPCPVPCDYYPYLWSTLSYVLIACLVLCCLTFFLYTCYTTRRLDRHIKL